MDRLFLIVTLVMVSLTMLFASNVYLLQSSNAQGGNLLTSFSNKALVSGVAPVAGLLDLWSNYTVKKTRKAAQDVVEFYDNARVFVVSTVILVHNAHKVLASG